MKPVLQLQVITPSHIARDVSVTTITAPTADGEITILPRHIKFFSVLKEGIVRYVTSEKKEDFLAIGGGYIETDGKQVKVLVSRAYGQNDIDETLTKRAIEQAEKTIRESNDSVSIHAAKAVLRRSFIDMKLLRRRRAPQGQ